MESVTLRGGRGRKDKGIPEGGRRGRLHNWKISQSPDFKLFLKYLKLWQPQACLFPWQHQLVLSTAAPLRLDMRSAPSGARGHSPWPTPSPPCSSTSPGPVGICVGQLWFKAFHEQKAVLGTWGLRRLLNQPVIRGSPPSGS